MSEPIRRWLDESVASDWLRHRLGLPCQQRIVGHEYMRPDPKAWHGIKLCVWLSHPQANRCFRPERCHGPAPH